MATFVDFSGRNIGPVVRFDRPSSLVMLREAIIRAENEGLNVHAMGSAWAFSAPAYCEGVIVDTSELAAFPEWLQAAVVTPQRGISVLVAVEAGIKIRNLDLALAGQARADGRPGIEGLRNGRALTPPTLGGAGGQSLAGAISTGTHGGDVARPPVGDFVHAMVVVGSGGVVRVIQRPGPLVVDFPRALREIRARLGPDATILNEQSPEAFDAALLSVGRFGVVYAYVFEVHDESGFLAFENRQKKLWGLVRGQLAGDVQRAAAGDEFLQVVVNPVPERSGARMCYVSRHRKLPEARRGDAGSEFGLGPVPSVPVGPERARAGISPDLGQALCADHLTPALATIRGILIGIGIAITVAWFPLGAIPAVPFFEIAASINRIGVRHRLGDVVADALNLATRVGRPELVEQVNRGLLDSAQSDRLPSGLFGPDRDPWLVHGPRWEIADFFDYSNDCYRGDSVEVFFPVDATLPDTVERLFGVFDEMRRAGTPIGAYISLRFLAPSRSLLATAAFAPSCAVEISMLRGLEGNTEALRRIQQVTLERGGRAHWGQQNDLDAATVSRMYGDTLRRWRGKLAELERDSPTFSTPFTRSHGLEPEQPEAWRRWSGAGIVSAGSPGVVPASRGVALEVFAVDSDGRVRASRRPGAAPAGGWREVRPEPVDPAATPVSVRNNQGAVELFVRAQDRLWHSWEQGGAGGQYSGWEVKGAFLSPGPRIDLDPAVAAHGDGRLEAFAREFPADGQRLLHTWARWLNGPWAGFDPLWNEPRLGGQPSACLRRHAESVSVTDQIVVVSTTEDGTVIWTAQTGPGGDSGWGPWRALSSAGGAVMHAGGRGSPVVVEVLGPGMRPHVFVIDAAGQVHEALEEDRVVAIGWLPWQPLPALTGRDRLDPSSRLAVAQTQRLWLFGRSQRSHVMAIELTPGAGWGAWMDLGGLVSGDVAAGALDDGRVEVLARNGADGQLMARRQVAPGRW